MQKSSSRLDQLQHAYPTILAFAEHEVKFDAEMAPIVTHVRDLITSMTNVDAAVTETQEAVVWIWHKGPGDDVSLVFYVSTSLQGQFKVGFTKKGTQAEKVLSAMKDNDGKVVFEKGMDVEFLVAAFTAIFDRQDVRFSVADGMMYCWIEQSVFVSYCTAGTKSGRIEISFSSSSPARNAILALGSANGGKLEPQPEDPTRRRTAPRKQAGTGAGS